MLENGLYRKVSLVAAPAGFGKSTFIGSWAQQNNHPLVWISLDEEENDSTMFWAYFVMGFQECTKSPLNIFGQLELSKLPPPKTILMHLINELVDLKEPIILVLDDYHVISNPQIHEAVTFLVENQPQQLHIIIITRADPPLPMARLRGYGELNEFRTDDLRFSSEEVATFLNETMSLELVSEEISQLDEQTEGWIIGLQLAALSLQNQSNKRKMIANFSGRHHYILDYLVEEVITNLSEELRDFLLKTSILHQFNTSLSDQVSNSSNCKGHLAYLRQHNLFLIPLDSEHQWFRYHHLFQDLLKEEFAKKFSLAEQENMFKRASQWYQQQGNLEEAVRYALNGKLFLLAADLIESIIEAMIAQGRIKTLIIWLETLPSEIIQTRPLLLMQQGWVVFLTGHVKLANELLQQAKKALTFIEDSSMQDKLEGKLGALQATLTALSRNLDQAICIAEEALAKLPTDDYVYRARALRAAGVGHAMLGNLSQALVFLHNAKTESLAGNNTFLASEVCSQIASVYKHQGKLTLSKTAYQNILDLYELPDKSPPTCLGYIGLAEIAFERNELERAKAYLTQGIQLCQEGSIGYALQPAYLLSGLLNHALGNSEAAHKSIKMGEELSHRGGGSLESIFGLAYFQTRLHLQLGEIEEAKSWASGEKLPKGWSFEDLPITLYEMHQSVMARVFLRLCDYDQVLKICESILPQAEQAGRNARVIELSLMRAAVYHKSNRTDEALHSITKAIRLAEPCAYMRLFLEIEPTIIPILLQNAKDHDICPNYTTKLLSAFQSPVDPVQFTGVELVEALTKREMEVLNWMSKGLSNQAIADKMIVSVNTIKKHTSNIYGKLGVRNRAQAMLKAQEIGKVGN